MATDIGSDGIVSSIEQLEEIYGPALTTSRTKELPFISDEYRRFRIATRGSRLIPGVNETIRINGRAVITTDDALCRSFAMGEKVPVSVIVVAVETIYYQCPKALVRSKLWDQAAHVARSMLPTNGQIIASIDASFESEAYDTAYPERMQQTIY